MTEQELDKFYNGLEELYEYYKDYSLQNIYDSLITSGLFDLSSKEDLDFVESFAYKIYYGVQNYNRANITWSEISNALKAVGDTMGHKENPVGHNHEDKFYKFIEENGFTGKTAKEILDELSNEWKERFNETLQ